jgi:hypothetical protein
LKTSLEKPAPEKTAPEKQKAKRSNRLLGFRAWGIDGDLCGIAGA